MKYRVIAIIAIISTAFAACHTNNTTESANLSLSPDAGSRYNQGQEVAVKVSVPSSIKADSIQYLIDSVRIT